MTLYTSPISTTTNSEADKAKPSTSKATLDPSYLPEAPTMVILHDLSLYLEEDDSSKCVFFWSGGKADDFLFVLGDW